MSQPPPLNRLYEEYIVNDPSKHLRLGQYFYNNYLSKIIIGIEYPYNIDTLYNSTDFEVIFNILEQIYKDYHWPTN